MRKALGVLAVSIAGVLRASPSSAAVSDANFSETTIVTPTGLGGTTNIAWAPDGSDRLFVARQVGQLRIVEHGVLLAKAFARPMPIVTDSECGLIGMAFDPAFVDNRYVYALVTRSSTEQQIVRYVADGNLGVEEAVVVAGLPTRGAGHNGGAVGFGPDGKLYWAIGDLDAPVPPDDLGSLASKVGRANRDGSVPEDNPFFDGAGPNEDRIWARGYRNPFSFTWQPTTERLWLNVVGAQYEQIFTPLAGDHGGWASYQNDQPEGFLSPIISYRTHGADSWEVKSAIRQAGVTTFTTLVPHRFHVGAKLTISGAADATFDTIDYISAVPSETSFSLPQVGPDASSDGGLASSLELGAAVTGGAFWDSSSVPEEYRGNFFFTDYISGHIARVVAPAGEAGEAPRVTSVDYWATATNPIDVDIGPDGDLYYATFAGGVYRVSYAATAQGIVVSKLHLRLDEGGRAAVGVRLALEPATPVSVSIANASGDLDVQPDLSLLGFDSSNWSVPQIVTMAAAQDDDAEPDRASIELAADDLDSEAVDVRVTEDEQVDAPLGGAGGSGGESSAPEAGGQPAANGGFPNDAAGEAGVVLGGAPSSAPVAGGEGGAGDLPVPSRAAGDAGYGCRLRTSQGPVELAAILLVPVAVRRRRRSARD